MKKFKVDFKLCISDLNTRYFGEKRKRDKSRQDKGFNLLVRPKMPFKRFHVILLLYL